MGIIFKKQTAKVNATIIIDGGMYVLQAGSKVAPANPSARPQLLQLRKEYAPDLIAIKDVYFCKPSQVASFVMGSNLSGDAFFKTCKQCTTEGIANSMVENIANPDLLETKQENNEPKQEENTSRKTKQQITKQDLKVMGEFVKRVKDFFKEVNIINTGTELVNPRVFNNFMNTKNKNDARDVFVDFGILTGAPDEWVDSVDNLCKSAEWDLINQEKDKVMQAYPQKQINERLIIYMGGAGTGKTTKAVTDNPDADTLAGSSTQDPSTLFGFFNLDTKMTAPTALARAMESGSPIIIDEFVLYSDDVLMRLQAITDQKTAIYDEITHQKINIKNGFKIIATMNLERPLPVALATRAQILNFDRRKAPELSSYLSWFMED